MKRVCFKVPLYDFDVILLQVESDKDKSAAKKEMKRLGCTEKEIDEELESVTKGEYNGATTWRNFAYKLILVIFHKFSSQRCIDNVFGHEKRHVEDRILEWANVNDIEGSAFLAGFLSEKFNKFQRTIKL